MSYIAGVDYGAKMAGTTVVACLNLENSEVQLSQSEKKKSADEWLLRLFSEQPAELIALDAPLSLPGYYQHKKEFTDYFYRESDRKLNAMSPMFLGGLTARAIKLRDTLTEKEIRVVETYPAALADMLQLKQLSYKKEKKHIAQVVEAVREAFTEAKVVPSTIKNWHQVDALLALYTAWRVHQDQAQFVGDKQEGGIYL